MFRKQPTEFVKVFVEESNEEVQCGICNKTFASMKALNNHAFMDHMDQCASGETSIVAKKIDTKPPSIIPKIKLKSIKPHTLSNQVKSELSRREQILASMETTSITTLASENVSYIIVKSEDALIPDRKKKKVNVKKEKRSRSPQPITGPFECVEPSPLGPDGICHQMFFSCCEYSSHARTEHSRRRRAARCQVCERPLSGGNVCITCGEGFQTQEDLQDHTVRKHTKERPYQCSICFKRFTQQGGVVQHMRMHTGVRPFPCTFCNKAFTQKSGLEQHLRTHTKAKPYRCVVCAKCFAQSVHLRQHMRTHTQLAPFRCLVCDKRFKQSSHLNYHLRYHNPSQLSAEQKEKYDELVTIIRRHSDRYHYGHETEDNVTTEVVETEEVETEQASEDLAEQIIAEQSIQEDDATYIIGDVIYE